MRWVILNAGDTQLTDQQDEDITAIEDEINNKLQDQTRDDHTRALSDLNLELLYTFPKTTVEGDTTYIKGTVGPK